MAFKTILVPDLLIRNCLVRTKRPSAAGTSFLVDLTKGIASAQKGNTNRSLLGRVACPAVLNNGQGQKTTVERYFISTPSDRRTIRPPRTMRNMNHIDPTKPAVTSTKNGI